MYREAFAAAPQALIAVDAYGVVRLVNDAAERLLRRPADAVVGTPLAAILTMDAATCMLRLPDGRTVPVLARAAPIDPPPIDPPSIDPPSVDPPAAGPDEAAHDAAAGGWTVLAIEDPAGPETPAVSRAALEDRVQVLAEAEREQESLLGDLIIAQERERARIAAGVHDDSLQVITAAMLRVQQLRRRLRDPGALEVLARIEESISMAADRLRRLIFDYRPPALERAGLTAAVRDALSRMYDDTGVAVHLDGRLVSEPSLPERLLLYRITKEALDNAATHAAAKSIDVTLVDDDGGYLIRVRDDGVGMPSGATDADPRPGHLGLVLMRERAEFAGGWFRLDTAPGSGTTVSVWVPYGATLEAVRKPPALRSAGCGRRSRPGSQPGPDPGLPAPEPAAGC
jgi:signal transduction histidine kinase